MAAKLTDKEKRKYMDIASRIVGFTFREKDLDMLTSIYDLILSKGGNTDMVDVLNVQRDVEAREIERLTEELKKKAHHEKD